MRWNRITTAGAAIAAAAGLGIGGAALATAKEDSATNTVTEYGTAPQQHGAATEDGSGTSGDCGPGEGATPPGGEGSVAPPEGAPGGAGGYGAPGAGGAPGSAATEESGSAAST